MKYQPAGSIKIRTINVDLMGNIEKIKIKIKTVSTSIEKKKQRSRFYSTLDAYHEDC